MLFAVKRNQFIHELFQLLAGFIQLFNGTHEIVDEFRLFLRAGGNLSSSFSII